MKQSKPPELNVGSTSVPSAVEESPIKTENSTMWRQLYESQESISPLGNLPLGSMHLLKDGQSFADSVISSKPSEKTSFGEGAAKAYAAKASKLRPSLLPVEAVEEGIKAMEFGAQKYGPHQWRQVDMQRDEFLDALERHIIALRKGETHAPDSGVHHLGHVIANCGIILAKFGK